jgi:23S rRNA (cytidine2498-2'-O)-methyltransferase
MMMTCQAGFESLLARELSELHGLNVAEKGPGWVRIGWETAAASAMIRAAADATIRDDVSSLVFAHLTLIEPIEVRGDSVNALAARIGEVFFGSMRNERIDAAWPNVWLGPQELVGLGRRISAVENAFGELLKKKLSRVSRLAVSDVPRGFSPVPVRGLFVFFADFGRAYVARAAVIHGQRRMADDPLAPSRSYLKVEEAYVVLGREPQPGETVCDLGAAPGGWSYSAAKRGAHVVAIDNGPLKGGALDHPEIEHRREDAFAFTPEVARNGEGKASTAQSFDWLFCDLVEEPHHVLRNIVAPWLTGGWCRHFVINLKFGRVDAIALLNELRAADSPFVAHARLTRIRHLYHDREELTLVGHVGPE